MEMPAECYVCGLWEADCRCLDGFRREPDLLKTDWTAPGGAKLLIAIDFDDTYTADVAFWRGMIQLGQGVGHRFICVSGRRDSFDNRRELQQALPEGVPVILSYDEPKRQCAKRLGFEPDIWIDDHPEAVVDGSRRKPGWD